MAGDMKRSGGVGRGYGRGRTGVRASVMVRCMSIRHVGVGTV